MQLESGGKGDEGELNTGHAAEYQEGLGIQLSSGMPKLKPPVGIRTPGGHLFPRSTAPEGIEQAR